MPERYLINSILRACNILKSFSRGKGTFKISELAQQLHLDRSTTYRILLSLEKSGLVEKNENTGEYALGVGAFEIGSAYLRRADLVQIAKPIMSDLALKVQETVHLAILSDTEILYLDKIDSPRTLGVMSKIGQRAPVYCTALGKALLAFQEEQERSRIIKAIKFKAFTPHTITSKSRLIKELKEVRKQGYALDYREIEEEVECIAAPIRNYLGDVIASISISGPQRKIHTPLEKKFVGHVLEAAALISSKMGYMENTIGKDSRA
ncbi:MAG: IclR family transcriptional regulator [Deltaproteobacteria bacterium]|nr:IclR family transcriptional regulator [Deltaproteobacteria bacterium]